VRDDPRPLRTQRPGRHRQTSGPSPRTQRHERPTPRVRPCPPCARASAQQGHPRPTSSLHCPGASAHRSAPGHPRSETPQCHRQATPTPQHGADVMLTTTQQPTPRETWKAQHRAARKACAPCPVRPPHRCLAGAHSAGYLLNAARERSQLAGVVRQDWRERIRAIHLRCIEGARSTRAANPMQLPDSSRAPECSTCGARRWHTIQADIGDDWCRACWHSADIALPCGHTRAANADPYWCPECAAADLAEHMDEDPWCNCPDCQTAQLPAPDWTTIGRLDP